ncbi:MAG: zinc dependent phospholipase C family protein [Anaeromyxobacter sp.]|nr:zinc dependent phospholipase C family protein [Anaeromyxobacter sp.]MBL0274792.1 zinc dependent phospholipase C family protein [Anaeromyxobacter sp.]
MLLRRALPAALATLALLILAWPSDALAWAPLAHLGFSAQALASLGPVPPALRGLLGEFSNEFLYGSLAADIVVGKSMARFVHHCHNWKVGFNVLEEAGSGPEQAFGWGFLAHLAADTVAHNYFVPWKIMGSFHKPRSGHAYWELRYDQRLDPALSDMARRVTGAGTRLHDRFLRRNLAGASVLPFPVSQQLFGSMVLSARLRRFQQVSRLALARERQLPLEDDLIEETNELAVEAILGLLLEGPRCEAAGADATGERNLAMAERIRAALVSQVKARRLTPDDAQALVAEGREAFRRAIHGTLVLPPRLARLAAA